MDVEQIRASVGSRSFWRRLVGMALVYALIFQPLLLTVADARLAGVSAIDDLALSQLCQHTADGRPVSPTDPHQRPADDHCAFCFAAASQLPDAPQTVAIRVGSVTGKAGPPTHALHLSSLARYSLACPRGPPLST